jgi:hypothetical protein
MEAVAARVERTPATTRRAALTAAVERRAAADDSLRRTAEALGRANRASAEAEANLARFADLDHRIAAARALLVRQDRSGPVPDSLVAEREQRRLARERAEESAGALQVLRDEHADAEKALREATEALSLAAMHVMLDEATALSDAARAAQHQLWHSGDMLLALDLMVTGASMHLPKPARAPIPALILRLLEPLNAQRAEFPSTSPANPVRQEVERWRALHAALMRDPAAAVSEGLK